MALTKTVLDLLNYAKKIEPKTPDLIPPLNALIALGESATGNSSEYKALKVVVDSIIKKREIQKKSLDLSGIKQLGNKWFSVKNRSKLFGTIEECSIAMNPKAPTQTVI